MSEQGRALVTGASRGIGLAIARRLAAQGFAVLGTATGEAGMASIREAGLEAAQLDIADLDSLPGFIKAQGHFDCVVHNAGITADNLLLRLDDAALLKVLQTNLLGAMSLSRACLRSMMKARSGRIICIGSVVGSTGNAGQTNYAASKAGLEGFVRALAREVGSRGITVNLVAPGFIDTDMTRALSDEQRAALQKDIPLGRLGAADDVAAAVAFLAGAEAAYVTGHTLHVNGGMYMG